MDQPKRVIKKRLKNEDIIRTCDLFSSRKVLFKPIGTLCLTVMIK